jgi:hypothetical protein
MLTYNDVTDLIMRAKQFEDLATTDGLTGLYKQAALRSASGGRVEALSAI